MSNAPIGSSYRDRKNAERARRRSYAEERMAAEGAARIAAIRSGIRTEVDANGRIWRAALPSKSNPNDAPYVLERSPRGVWMHTCSRCPAWIKGVKCWHIIVLEELCQETEK